jgi:hypothetical protein
MRSLHELHNGEVVPVCRHVSCPTYWNGFKLNLKKRIYSKTCRASLIFFWKFGFNFTWNSNWTYEFSHTQSIIQNITQHLDPTELYLFIWKSSRRGMSSSSSWTWFRLRSYDLFFQGSRCSWSLHLRLGLPMSRRPLGWYWEASFGMRFLSIRFRWSIQFFWFGIMSSNVLSTFWSVTDVSVSLAVQGSFYF